MSLQNFFGDLLSGNIENAKKRVVDWLVDSLPATLSSAIRKLISDEMTVLWNATTTFAEDVVNGKSVPDAGKEAIEVLASQGIHAGIDDILTIIRLQADQIKDAS